MAIQNFACADGDVLLAETSTSPLELLTALPSRRDVVLGTWDGTNLEIVEHQGKRLSDLELRYLLVRKQGLWIESDSDPNLEAPGTGDLSGFLDPPQTILYPYLWKHDKMRREAKRKLMMYLLAPIEAAGYKNPKLWLRFTAFGSGASFNWNDAGDFDVHVWADVEAFNRANPALHLMSDDLLVLLRRIIIPINSVPLNTVIGGGANMAVQYYPLAGKGTKQECLATRPYACYDMRSDEWYQYPKPITPDFYGGWFLLVEPKARLIAQQGNAILDSCNLNLADYMFWNSLAAKYNNPKYQTNADLAKQQTEADWTSVRVLWKQLFDSRQEAYSPSGEGLNDARDQTNKLLEVWGVAERLKERAYHPLPWDETTLPASTSAAYFPEDLPPGRKDQLWNVDPDKILAKLPQVGSVWKFQPTFSAVATIEVVDVEVTDDPDPRARTWYERDLGRGLIRCVVLDHLDPRARSRELTYTFDNWINRVRLGDLSLIGDGDVQLPFTSSWKHAIQDPTDTSQGVQPMCMYCGNFRLPDNSWSGSNPQPSLPLSHTICSGCMQQQFPNEWKKIEEMGGWQHAMSKTATWADIEAKATRLREEGRVHILRNAHDVIVGRVDGDHGTYTTQVWRDDPNSLAITEWDCECQWSDFAWQRTRQWKKYEGRPCSHVLALFWEALSQPMEGDEGEPSPEAPQDQGPPQIGVPGTSQPGDMSQPGDQSQSLPYGIISPGTMPAGPPIPGAANPPLPGSAPPADAPPAPAGAPVGPPPSGAGGASSQPTQPGQGGTVSIPGAFSSWKHANVVVEPNDPELQAFGDWLTKKLALPQVVVHLVDRIPPEHLEPNENPHGLHLIYDKNGVALNGHEVCVANNDERMVTLAHELIHVKEFYDVTGRRTPAQAERDDAMWAYDDLFDSDNGPMWEGADLPHEVEVEMQANWLYEEYLSQRQSSWKKARTTLYHSTMVSPDVIMQHGIDWQQSGSDGAGYEGLPRANYLWETYEQAAMWAPSGYVYTVDATGLHLEPDPYFDVIDKNDPDWEQGAEHGGRGAFYTLDTIPPDRITEVDTRGRHASWKPEGWDLEDPYDTHGMRCPICKNPTLDYVGDPETQGAMASCRSCGWHGEALEPGHALRQEGWQPFARLARYAFIVISPDVEQLASNTADRLLARPDISTMGYPFIQADTGEASLGVGGEPVPGAVRNPKFNDTLYRAIVHTLRYLVGQFPEGFKFYPWVVTQLKRGTVPGDYEGRRHLLDILRSAHGHMEYLRTRPANPADPLPDINRMTFPELEQWVYERNALGTVPTTEGGLVQWDAQQPTHDLGNGWGVYPVESENDLRQEGDLMGHCVGSYAGAVTGGHSSIFSLRDPRGLPHVTTEFENQWDLPPSNVAKRKLEGYNLVQVQGKGNTVPKPEYQEMMKNFFKHIQEHQSIPISQTVELSDIEELRRWYANDAEDGYDGSIYGLDQHLVGNMQLLAEEIADGAAQHWITEVESDEAAEALGALSKEMTGSADAAYTALDLAVYDKISEKAREMQEEWQEEYNNYEQQYNDWVSDQEDEWQNDHLDDDDEQYPGGEMDFEEWLREFSGLDIHDVQRLSYEPDFNEEAEQELPSVLTDLPGASYRHSWRPSSWKYASPMSEWNADPYRPADHWTICPQCGEEFGWNDEDGLSPRPDRPGQACACGYKFTAADELRAMNFLDNAHESQWKHSTFMNGDTVRAQKDMQGIDRDQNIITVPRNSIGEVLTSDEVTTVAIFPLRQNAQLEPHLVKVEEMTAAFVKSNRPNPFIRRRT